VGESRDLDASSAWSRRLGLLRLLIRRGRLTTREAARALGVDRRKARDDLEALCANGVPLGTHGDNRDRCWTLSDAWRDLGLRVGLEERLSVRFGRQIVESFLHETDLGEAMERIDRQLEALDEANPDGDSALARRFVYVKELEKDYASSRAVISALIEAIVRSHRVAFDYAPARAAATERQPPLCPLTLAVYKRGLYLIADVGTKEPRLFAVERISALEPHPNLPFPYPRASEYDPERLLRHRMGVTSGPHPPAMVRVRFRPEVRTYVESRTWKPDQRVTPTEDGGCLLEFEASGPELVSKILEFGDKAHVLEPQWLRDAVITELRGALARYDADSAQDQTDVQCGGGAPHTP
jgi:predicted DNA-binding transcriptional regulator YafY